MEQLDFSIKTRNRTFVPFDNGKEKEWTGPFYFIQGADTQYGMIESFLEKKEDPKWDKEIELTRKLVEAVNKMHPKPKFFVICGDLLDAFPDQDPTRRELQERDFKIEFAKLDSDIPLVCVCGNHDVGNTPTTNTVQRYRSSFGDDYFSFWRNGVFFIVINSQFYFDDSLVKDLAEEQDKWLDEQLEQLETSKSKHAIVFQHIPLFINNADEDDTYFSLRKDVRLKMLEKFQNAGITAIFCGHYHQNAGGFYGTMEQVVTSAIGAQLNKDTPHGVRIVKLDEKAVTHKYYGIDELPSTILI